MISTLLRGICPGESALEEVTFKGEVPETVTDVNHTMEIDRPPVKEGAEAEETHHPTAGEVNPTKMIEIRI